MNLTEEKLERYKIDDISPVGLDTIKTLQEGVKKNKKEGTYKWLSDSVASHYDDNHYPIGNSGCTSPSTTAGTIMCI